jgi:hypothetical protein
MMKRVFVILAAIVPVLAGVTVASAQQTTSQSTVEVRTRVQGPEGGPPAPMGNMVFIESELYGGKTVKGAPYSAESVTESIQTLSDGNRIVNKMSSKLFRDSEGRTRREQTIKLLGTIGDNVDPLQTIFINDPVTGTSYVLDSKSHTARTMKSIRFMKGGPGAATQRFEFHVDGGPAGGTIVKTPDTAPAPGVPVPAPESDHFFTIQTGTAGGGAYMFRRSSNENEVKEQLGKQIVEGVEAEGTRTTITIPAGEIGNEKPIQIVSESWYSAELQMVVMSKHSDPRSGETTFRLTNISRLEPAKSLFEVPGDFTIKSETPGMPSIMTLPAKIRKQE